MKTLKKHLAQWHILQVTLLSDAELCEDLQIHSSTSFRWRKTQKLPYLRIGRKIYYRMSDLLPFVSNYLERNPKPL